MTASSSGAGGPAPATTVPTAALAAPPPPTSPSGVDSSLRTIDAARLEEGLALVKSLNLNRPDDGELRVLFFTATYFVLDGVTLTIRRIESHLRAKGAAVKVLTTVPDEMTAEQANDVIAVPGIKIPFDHAGSYAFGVGLDAETIHQIEEFNPTCVHFTVPDFVALDGIRWCQRNNVAYIATWHSNYCDYLKVLMYSSCLAPLVHGISLPPLPLPPPTHPPTTTTAATITTPTSSTTSSSGFWARRCTGT